MLLFYVSQTHWSQSELASWFRGFVNLNGEANLPAWYSSTLWLIAAHHCLRAGRSEQAQGLRYRPLGWFVIAAGCVLLSLDEAALLHETIGGFIDKSTGNPNGYAPVYSWVKVAAVVVAVTLVALLPFLAALPRATAIGLLAAGAIFILGAMGMETIGSLVQFGTLANWPVGLSWNRAFVVEEFLEMSGVILLAATVRSHLARLAAARGPQPQTLADG